jgi:quinol-cytochrome oxidoreductase complex cytochrome b subunit
MAALRALIPTWITFPLLYTAASPLPPPVALGVTAMVASLVPAFAFSYLRRRPRGGARSRSFSARRWAAGVAGMGLLVACQVAAIAGLNLPEANSHDARLALPQAVGAAVARAKHSFGAMVDRVTQHVPSSNRNDQ